MKGGEAVEGWGWFRKVQVVGQSPLQHSPVVKMVWSNEQRAFAVETHFSQSHSIVAVQRAFRIRYQIPPQDGVPDRKSILLRVENFRGKGIVSKKRRGRPRTSRTPENIEAVRRSVLAVSQALCTQTCVRPWHLKSFCSSNSSPRPPLPSLQDGRCSRTYTTGLD